MIKKREIRPQVLLDSYLKLSLKDAKKIHSDELEKVDCPGCGNSVGKLKFQKVGFSYLICQKCGSLYCSPRPNKKALATLNKNSESAHYWATVFFPAVAEVRREKLFKKKAEMVFSIFQEKGQKPQKICDVGAGYGIFLEELSRVFIESECYAIEPFMELAKRCREKHFSTLEANVEESRIWENRFDLVINSEVIEHVFSPFQFINSLYRLVCPGGYCLMTGLGYEGFDILTLKEKSESVFPPHHLNFLSIQGFKRVFKSAGFREIEVWTPGEMDVDLVLNSGIPNDFMNVLKSRGSEAIEDFQRFLQQYKLSSHVWVLAQK
jgi:SAM-dependent methyltransferase